jgi:phosphoadenosine phosphosulfate reductase
MEALTRLPEAAKPLISPVKSGPVKSGKERARELEALYGHLPPHQIIKLAVEELFPGDIASVSSFGADSAVLLHLVASADPTTPVLFLETGKHFDETLSYRDELVSALGLTDLRNITPLPETLASDDPDGRLHKTSTDACCAIRKVEPLARAVVPFAAWFTGRKRFQAETRAKLPVFEAVGERIRINPLAGWGAEELAAYQEAHALPEHPLIPYGYYSIGCLPCTEPSSPDDPRAGRWAGKSKTECGIHLGGLDSSLDSSSL